MKRLKLWNRLGLRGQLIVLSLVIFGGIFTTFSAAMFWYIDRIHRTEFDTALYNYVVDVAHRLRPIHLTDEPPYEFLSNQEMILPFSHGETLLQVSRLDGTPVIRSANMGGRTLPFLGLDQKMGAPVVARYRDLRWSPGGDARAAQRYRAVSYVFHHPELGGFVVQAAVPMIHLNTQHESLVIFFFVSVPILLLIAALGALGLTRRAMRPVSAMAAKAEEIEAHHLSERIPVPEFRDEIQQLALTLNNLLDRLEKAFRSQEGFIADASHQLKTPLSILKGELEVFRQGRRTPEELEAFLDSAASEIQYLSQMTGDLLLLAQIDNEEMATGTSSFRLDEKLLECVSRRARLAKARQVELNVELQPPEDGRRDGETELLHCVRNDFEYEGEPELIRSLIENLVDNAVKYSPMGGTAKVKLSQTPSYFELTVSDDGPGVTPAALPHIFNRFYRTESARQKASGTGLGLAIVKRIAELHGGTVKVMNRPEGGAHFVIQLPVRDRDARTPPPT